MSIEINELIALSHKLGTHPEYIQGGGGNTSVKISDSKMCIKASGLRLSDLKTDFGIVGVRYDKIKNFYHANNEGDIDLLTSASSELINDSVFDRIGNDSLRPSIETGFHALLDKYVAHSHSVYANILNCSNEGKDLIHSLFNDSLFVHYYSPGPFLTIAINNKLKENSIKGEQGLLFLENHGIIIQGSDSDQVSKRHDQVNYTIKERLNIIEDYPTISVKEVNNGEFVSASAYTKQFIINNPKVVEQFNNIILFPDQVVYGSDISYVPNGIAKIRFDIDAGAIIYKTTKAEANTFEEVFVAWAYIYENIRKAGFTIKNISKKDSEYISNMESEKYRKKII